jgi:hypothetical protein
MAINTWIQVTKDPAAASKPDRADHIHITKAGTADGGDVTVAWDNTSVTSLTVWDSCVSAARTQAISRGLK